MQPHRDYPENAGNLPPGSNLAMQLAISIDQSINACKGYGFEFLVSDCLSTYHQLTILVLSQTTSFPACDVLNPGGSKCKALAFYASGPGSNPTGVGEGRNLLNHKRSSITHAVFQYHLSLAQYD